MRSSQGNDVADTSDVEITLAHNEIPQRPATSLRPWHVHLELRPEQLVALHRLGFTGGALAWREGMDEWQPLRDGGEPSDGQEDSAPNAPLAPVTPLAEARRNHPRDSSRPPPVQGSGARITPFARARANVPPIAGALPVPLVRLRHPVDRPPPPSIELAKGPLPSFAADAVATLPPMLPQAQPAYPVAFEPKPTSVPPLALEPAAEPPRRGVSRALLLGAAALVALSASNGVLASALVWSLRKEPARAETPPAASIAALPPAPPLAAPPVSAQARNGPATGTDRPLSVDQLPLVASVHASRTTTHEAQALPPAARASSNGEEPAPTRKRNRRARAEDDAPAPRRNTKSEEPPSSEPPDRRAVARAVARAAGAASTCAPGPEKGRVSLTFAPSGNVQSVSLLQGFGDTGINSCVLRSMGRARVRPFSGEPVTVQKTLSW